MAMSEANKPIRIPFTIRPYQGVREVNSREEVAAAFDSLQAGEPISETMLDAIMRGLDRAARRKELARETASAEQE